jgi:hypothetical protein
MNCQCQDGGAHSASNHVKSRLWHEDQPRRFHHFYERTCKHNISKSFSLTDDGVKFVEIVRDVLRYVPLYWTATEVVCSSNIVQSDIAYETRVAEWGERLGRLSSLCKDMYSRSGAGGDSCCRGVGLQAHAAGLQLRARKTGHRRGGSNLNV